MFYAGAGDELKFNLESITATNIINISLCYKKLMLAGLRK